MTYQTENQPFYKRWWFILIAVFIGIGIIGSFSENTDTKEIQTTSKSISQNAQSSKAGLSPAEYICDKFDGTLSDIIEERSFVGETYRCDVEEQWDMMIMDEINYMMTEDEYFGSAKEWKKTFVDTENYSRRSFSFESDEYFIVNLYVSFEKKTDHFYIAE